MSPTLYDKIREAVFRDPRLTPQQVQKAENEAAVRAIVEQHEVFLDAKAAQAEEAILPTVQAPKNGLGESVEGEGASQAQSGGAHHARYGGGLNVARAGSQDGERINSLTATVTAIQAVVAKDQQQANDLAHFARFANDAIRVHSGLVK